MYIHTLVRVCESRRRFSLFSPLNIYHIFFFLLFPPCCRVSSSFPSSTAPQAQGHPRPSLLPPCLPSACPPLLLSSVCAPLKLYRRPSVCPAVCRPAPAVTRQPSGARQYDSVGRCTAYISPALSPLARHVLPCVPLPVPWLVLPAVVCRLVVTIACTPLYPGRRRCGAASVM